MEDKCILGKLRVYNQGGGGVSSEQGFTWHQIIDKENNDL